MSWGTRWPRAWRRGEDLLTFAAALQVRLPGTRAALRDGIVTVARAQVIVSLTALLDPDEALARRPATRRHLPVDHPLRPPVRHPTHPVPDLAADGMPRPSPLLA